MDVSDDVIVPPEVAEAFITAALTTLRELAQIEAHPTNRTLSPTSAAELGEPVVSATIRLQRQPAGTMSLRLAAEAATNLAVRYLPPGTTLSEELIDDVAAEFANVIAGQAKTMLKGTPYHFHLSTPLVSRATKVAAFPEASPTLLVVQLESELGSIQLRLT